MPRLVFECKLFFNLFSQFHSTPSTLSLSLILHHFPIPTLSSLPPLPHSIPPLPLPPPPVDKIQCAGADLVAAVRADAIKNDPVNNPKGDYYALHIRRGDFQYKVRCGVCVVVWCMEWSGVWGVVLCFGVLLCGM